MQRSWILIIALLIALCTLGISYSAWSQNLNIGTTNYPNTISIAQSPTVAAGSVTNLTADSATLNGLLTRLGTMTPVNVYFKYSTSTVPSDDTPTWIQAGSLSSDQSPGNAFHLDLAGLVSSTTYHFRAKAAGYWTAYSPGDSTFTTPAPSPVNVTKAPTAIDTSYTRNWTNPGNVYADDSNYARDSTSGHQVTYETFNFPTIPSGSTINGIEVIAKGYDSGTRTFDFSLSPNGGSNFYKATNPTCSFSSSESTITLGGPSDKWGRTSWSLSNFTNTNFRVRIQTNGGTGTIYLNIFWVTVYYTPP
jgi:hypothetical protein